MNFESFASHNQSSRSTMGFMWLHGKKSERYSFPGIGYTTHRLIIESACFVEIYGVFMDVIDLKVDFWKSNLLEEKKTYSLSTDNLAQLPAEQWNIWNAARKI